MQNISCKKYIKGFTLYEVMVTTGIIAILSAISFYGLNTYADYFTLKEASRGVDALVRTTQGYAINVQDVGESEVAYIGRYGISFSKSNNTEIISFVGNVNNYQYDSPADQFIQNTVLGRGVKITNVCYKTTDNPLFCEDKFSKIDILYIRPKPDAKFSIENLSNDKISEVEFTLESSKGRKATVIVGATGYIANE